MYKEATAIIHSPHLDEEYTAISYTWGKLSSTHPIYFTNGSHILVT